MRRLEFDILLPEDKLAPNQLGELRTLLSEKFGGATLFRGDTWGAWQAASGQKPVTEKIALLRVLAEPEYGIEEYFTKLKTGLAKALGEEEILVVMREVLTL